MASSCRGLAQTPGVWRRRDQWLRHRLRAIQLRHGKRSRTIYREAKARGATEDAARQVAGNCHRWWRNSDGVIKTVLTIAYSDRLGCRACPDLTLSNRPVRTRTPGGVAGGRPLRSRPSIPIGPSRGRPLIASLTSRSEQPEQVPGTGITRAGPRAEWSVRLGFNLKISRIVRRQAVPV